VLDSLVIEPSEQHCGNDSSSRQPGVSSAPAAVGCVRWSSGASRLAIGELAAQLLLAHYEQHELDAYLAEDAKALRRFLELADATAVPLRKIR
jgi:hypothetical protein